MYSIIRFISQNYLLFSALLKPLSHFASACEIAAGRRIGVVLHVACKTHAVTRMLYSISALATTAVQVTGCFFGVFIKRTAGNPNAEMKVRSSL